MNLTKPSTICFIFLLFYYVQDAKPASRDTWIANADGTVTDVATGLVWQQQSSLEQLDYAQAVSYCEAMALGGEDGWRLPNIKELMSIADYRFDSPTIDKREFVNTNPAIYWSSSSRANSSSNAWVVNFSLGNVGFFAKSSFQYVRCVRS